MQRTYDQAIKALNSLQSNHAMIKHLHANWDKIKPQRDSMLVPEMKEYIRRVGYTTEDLNNLNVLHITGTKGKGSTSAFLESILREYGLKTGLYTSPHLITVRERLRINGVPIPEEKFARYFFDVWDKLEAAGTTSSSKSTVSTASTPGIGDIPDKPMYFRFLTLVSFHAFLNEKIDTSVYEVGIGGEYDSTNVFSNPIACGITSLGIDHTQILGTTIEEIAWNKAGIFKPNTPAFTIDQNPPIAIEVLRNRAIEKQVSKFEVVPVHEHLKHLNFKLHGDFQQINATIACYMAAEKLQIKLDPNVLPPRFVKALEQTQWPGRCQIINQPNTNTEWFVDGAHTFESLKVAADWFAKTVNRSKPITLVFNQQKRDNVDDLLVSLYNELTKVHQLQIKGAVFTTNKTSSYGFTDDMLSLNVSKESVDNLVIQKQLAEVWQKVSPQSEVTVCSNLQEVINKVSGQVFCTGSLLMVGSLLSIIQR